MRVAVIGAGIAGTLTAHYLFERGCDVVVYDRAQGPASMSSKANGGQLSYSFCDAMADPQLLRKLPGILFGKDPAFQIRIAPDLNFMRWGLSFLGQCTTRRRDGNTARLLNLAQRSAELMNDLADQTNTGHHIQQAGKLVLLNTLADDELKRRVQLKVDQGFDIRILNQDEVFELEPAIRTFQQQPLAVIYSPGDEVANAHTFVSCLARSLESRGVTFRFEQDISQIEASQTGSCFIHHTHRTHQETETSKYDAVVIATGQDLGLMSSLGIRVPILPMSGYSWSFPACEGSPSVSITALAQRLVFSRIDNTVRIAGFADVNPKTNEVAQRIELLRHTAQAIAPHAADFGQPLDQGWHGVRAMTPDSNPIVGRTKLPGVYLNLGHGMLGWTLGAATSEHVAQQVANSV